MLGLFGTLNLGAGSLQAQRQGVEVAGQNLANVNNPAYARQRLMVQTSVVVPSSVGPQGTGVEATAIQQVRSTLLDRQIQSELSLGGYWEAQEQALEYAQASLGESLDHRAAGAGTAAVAGVTGAAPGLLDTLNGLFQSFQQVAAAPASMADRQVLVGQAQTLTRQLHQADTRLEDLRASLAEQTHTQLREANGLLQDVADLNGRIAAAERYGTGPAHDLRDQRQARVEALAKLMNVEAALQPDGSLNLATGGTLLVEGRDVTETLAAADAGGGRLEIRGATSGAPIPLAGGSIHGTMVARDTTVAGVQQELDTLASALVREVNAPYVAGYDLAGGTGAVFFTGTDAGDIGLNPELVKDPARLQAAGVAGEPGDNAVILGLARLADQRWPALGGQTFADQYTRTVTAVGEALSSTSREVEDQALLQKLLTQQRQAVSGVSLDEEMTDLMKYQKAFEASARLVATIGEMLDTVVNLKR